MCRAFFFPVVGGLLVVNHGFAEEPLGIHNTWSVCDVVEPRADEENLAPIGLELIQQRRVLLEQKLELGMDGHEVSSPKTPPVVLISVWINDIDSVSSSRNEWHGDVVATIRYNESAFADAKPKLHVYNGHITAITEYRKQTVNGVVSETTRMRVKMTMKGDFDIFPFDKQSLEIQFILEGFSSLEAIFQKDPDGENGIHTIDSQTGRRFNEAQFRIIGWEMKVESRKSSGVPYYKSHAQMTVVAGRFLPYYFLTCGALPSLPTMFAVASFHLPIDKGYRHTITFVAFLALFVHLKQTMSYIPPGVWCWVMTELTFFCAIITVAITGNFCSAILVKYHVPLANRHDHILMYLVPLEVSIGETLLLVFQRQHFLVGFCIMMPIILLNHGLLAVLFLVEARKKDDTDLSPVMKVVSLSFVWGPIAARTTESKPKSKSKSESSDKT